MTASCSPVLGIKPLAWGCAMTGNRTVTPWFMGRSSTPEPCQPDWGGLLNLRERWTLRPGLCLLSDQQSNCFHARRAFSVSHTCLLPHLNRPFSIRDPLSGPRPAVHRKVSFIRLLFKATDSPLDNDQFLRPTPRGPRDPGLRPVSWLRPRPGPAALGGQASAGLERPGGHSICWLPLPGD